VKLESEHGDDEQQLGRGTGKVAWVCDFAGWGCARPGIVVSCVEAVNYLGVVVVMAVMKWVNCG
jgi:hypothetical protein